ncbi:U-scoloptoxin(19)-Sm1a-like [Achroia grisella]|uniref:U-scoloptoxin(19)-Sm1a-like n=1 Tax=Achroia grisella TaxID=688607 RepID=UPI0027D2367F|nr:U-scoloptoxin(19)-Sm1a-like [Achroia grisella]
MWSVLFCSVVVFTAVAGNDDGAGSENAPEAIYNELPCLAYGGECVLKSECPDGKLSKLNGLCPIQQKQDVECCYKSPNSTTRCKRRGGECIASDSHCPKFLLFAEATDCSDNEKCCIFIN